MIRMRSPDWIWNGALAALAEGAGARAAAAQSAAMGARQGEEEKREREEGKRMADGGRLRIERVGEERGGNKKRSAYRRGGAGVEKAMKRGLDA
jgi:hypothetical protein